jgi:hypothetical protein
MTRSSYTILVVFLISVGILSCKLTSKFDQPTILHGEAFESPDSLGFPRSLTLIDSFIIIAQWKFSSGMDGLKVFNTNSHRLVARCGHFGKGPGELTAARSVTGDYSDRNVFWVYDNQLQRLTKYSLRFCMSFESITLSSGLPSAPFWISDSNLISAGLTLTEGRFGLYDGKGDLQRSIGAIPPGRPEGIPVPVYSESYQGTTKLKPDGSLFVAARNYADQLDIYDTKGLLVKHLVGPMGFSPKFQVGNSGGTPVMVLKSSESRYGYLDVAVTDQSIYALFSGKKMNEDSPYYGLYVHVFNWSGNLMASYKLESPTIAIAVDTKARTLFAVQHEPTVAVLVYNLPTL